MDRSRHGDERCGREPWCHWHRARGVGTTTCISRTVRRTRFALASSKTACSAAGSRISAISPGDRSGIELGIVPRKTPSRDIVTVPTMLAPSNDSVICVAFAGISASPASAFVVTASPASLHARRGCTSQEPVSSRAFSPPPVPERQEVPRRSSPSPHRAGRPSGGAQSRSAPTYADGQESPSPAPARSQRAANRSPPSTQLSQNEVSRALHLSQQSVDQMIVAEHHALIVVSEESYLYLQALASTPRDWPSETTR
jgi:hypothetical protein